MEQGEPARLRIGNSLVSDTERRALALTGAGDVVFDWDVPGDRVFALEHREADQHHDQHEAADEGRLDEVVVELAGDGKTVAGVGLLLIVYLAIHNGYDRAILLIPTWLLLLAPLWMAR
jgi:hypothetical protein